MRVRWLACLGRACVCSIAFVCLGCAGSTDGGSTSSGGAVGQGGGAAETGGSAATGGSPIQPNGGASGSVGACLCPSGGDPYSVLVQGDGDASILTRNVEIPATAALACSDWLTGPLRGSLLSTCGGTLNITFAACAELEAIPSCLLVDHNAVTYVDRDGARWTGSASNLQPSTSPTIRDMDRQEGTFSVEVTREGVRQTLSVVYVLCGPGKPAAAVPPC